MNKQEAIERLEVRVAEYDRETGEKLVSELRSIIRMEPSGWEPAQDAIIWQGFRIYRKFRPYGSGYALVTDVVFTREEHGIFGKRTETWQGYKYIDNPRHMLNILKYETPWEEQ